MIYIEKNYLLLSLVVVITAVFFFGITGANARNIPYRFASAEEGRELLLSNTEYYGKFSQNDIDFRVHESGATIDELLKISVNEIQDFNFIEKLLIDRCIAKMEKTIEKKGYVLPPIEEIVFIKTDMSTESGASGYTHDTQIYLNATALSAYTLLSIIPEFSKSVEGLLWHELFHCLTRSNPEFRSRMYSLIHFTITDSDFELPPCILEYYLNNPDVEHHDSYAAFIIDDQRIDCFTAWITTMHYSEAQSGFSSCSTTALIPIDGTDVYYMPEQASNFYEVFGKNTDYVIDPEECMADNFKYAMLYGMDGEDGQGYPNPEIIQGILDIVSR